MLKLDEDEKVLMVIHKHWFLIARQAVTFLILLVLPSVILSLLPTLLPDFDLVPAQPFINLLLVLYLMVLLILFFLAWMDHYLDMWIVTTERIMETEQNGLFNREISEIPIENVQDITIEVKGLLETLFKFGTIHIQTAGEKELKMQNVPALYEMKNIILESARRAKKYGGAQQVGTDKT